MFVCINNEICCKYRYFTPYKQQISNSNIICGCFTNSIIDDLICLVYFSHYLCKQIYNV
ncbi:hypothetical protein DWY73_16410 [Bacteroides fragilis]|nr:hypothetical protein DWY73_16410 [Bacteroides fragilis]RHK10524.1 hypothetical protein DW078_23695 [Bacteroides fragilis]